MRNARIWLFGAVFGATLCGLALLGGPETSWAQPGTVVAPGDSHWRYHNGHWSFYHKGDKRWYYTNGTNWFYNNGKAWEPYRFDKEFGREGFARGNYVPPAPGTTVVVPTHEVYVPR